jgi:hypothetical protein
MDTADSRRFGHDVHDVHERHADPRLHHGRHAVHRVAAGRGDVELVLEMGNNAKACCRVALRVLRASDR